MNSSFSASALSTQPFPSLPSPFTVLFTQAQIAQSLKQSLKQSSPEADEDLLTGDLFPSPNPAVKPHKVPSYLQLEVSRPRSIAELEEKARRSLRDNIQSFAFETLEIMVEIARRDAENFFEEGELESAFIEFTRAVTIISKKMPSRPGEVLRVPIQMEGRYRNLASVSYSSACGWSSTDIDNFHL